MQQTIDPRNQTVESCLKNKSYYIDFYQREYVWSKDTVETLLRDIFYAFELSYEQYKDAELSQEVLEISMTCSNEYVLIHLLHDKI